MPEEKYIEQRKQRFRGVTFVVTSFCAKRSKKLRLLCEGKNPKL